MRLKLLALRNGLMNFIHAKKYASIGKPPRCDAHMNELPIPCIPWEPWYSDKQSYYNKILFLGVAWWLFSLGMVIYTKSIFLNWKPPRVPGPPSDEAKDTEECD